MAWPEAQCATTRQMILDSAARLFATGGYGAVSIDEIMQSAGLTRGAFYHHFSSKRELYTEALRNGARAGGALLDRAGREGLKEVVQAYLCMEHREGEDMHCPLAFMVSDAARQGGSVQRNYTQLLQAFIARISASLASETEREDHQQAVQIAVSMIGGLALARAVDDKALAAEILTASQQLCFQFLD
ncbi:TetR/AcrR family transcriptional regulator [Erwiniaceae bacterium BAC15a-03b]|uniref:TetR/AcrR family transcriptional regulator n=1 Tax=Winslowiella arboricola TaxID=2978220 RepID=A0A9J6PQT3_9GAMM|nr:TetR/AcrR family transcriptional regulator [Winslowiella arboricola]MCU5772397.1 TetR/AcrR family transcriptional regulator [Winslowiella arboricola]MCU5779810.1 TetR/AcrR family transcriptional regulator [Winslowiella arboricola]